MSSDESRAVVRNVVAWLEGIPPSAVLVYLSMDREIAAEEVVPLARNRHRFFVTRTPPTGPLTVHAFDAPREIHRLGYSQPVPSTPELPSTEVDVVLVPGLCFDRAGGRLGWGKGYYDALLSSVRPDVMAVGVTLDRLMVRAVPMLTHDVRMTHLATESGVAPVAAAP